MKSHFTLDNGSAEGAIWQGGEVGRQFGQNSYQKQRV